jgi:hypothetical protein
MQTKLLLPAAGNLINAGITGSIVQYNPISSTVGLLLLSLVTTTTAAVTLASASIELQGSVNDVEWFTLLSVPVGSLKISQGGIAVGTLNGQSNYAQVVQTMPHMRIMATTPLATGAGAATTFLRAVLLNG